MKKKVAILVPYSSPSVCGVWSRAIEDAKALQKENYRVRILSSDILKSTKKRLSKTDTKQGIHVIRFRTFLNLGRNALFWNPFFYLVKYSPDIVHTHGFRHPHSLLAFIYAKLFRKKIIITTHGSFEKDNSRGFFYKIVDLLYDFIFGFWELNFNDGIIMVAKWEKKYLKKFGVSTKKLKLIPNSISSLFFKTKLKNREIPFKKIIFFGRVDPVKNVDFMIQIAKSNKDINFGIYGPLQGYKLPKILPNNLEIKLEKYTENDAIKYADNADIYMFVSKRESMGKACVEAMSRGCLVIATHTKGAMDLIKDKENGYMISSSESLVSANKIIQKIYKNWKRNQKVSLNAVLTAKSYKPTKISKKLLELYLNLKTKK